MFSALDKLGDCYDKTTILLVTLVNPKYKHEFRLLIFYFAVGRK